MIAVNANLCFPLSNLKVIGNGRQIVDVFVPYQAYKGKCYSLEIRDSTQLTKSKANKATHVVLPGTSGIEVSSSVEEFAITASSSNEDGKIKITVEVSGTKTKEIYDEVLSKMAHDAQPIRGFRRVKGGKTPDIPEHILLEILGQSNVHGKVIRKVINSATAEYVSKVGLNVGKNLQIEQSLEELEARFEAGAKFRFDAIVQSQDL